MPEKALKAIQNQVTSRVFDFQQEKMKLEGKQACPTCQAKGEYCPDWVYKLVPGSKEHRELPRRKKFEFLLHTTHLIE